MQTSVTPLTAKSQTLVSVLLGTMACMGIAPIVESIVARWPVRFGELPWRFDTFALLLNNGPQLVILFSVIALLGTFSGHRQSVRLAAVALGFIAIAAGLLLPVFILDFFQARHLIGIAKTTGFKVQAMRTAFFSIVVTVGGAWGAWRAWQSSEREGAGQRRKQGEGLVVGQPKGTPPPNAI